MVTNVYHRPPLWNPCISGSHVGFACWRVVISTFYPFFLGLTTPKLCKTVVFSPIPVGIITLTCMYVRHFHTLYKQHLAHLLVSFGTFQTTNFLDDLGINNLSCAPPCGTHNFLVRTGVLGCSTCACLQTLVHGQFWVCKTLRLQLGSKQAYIPCWHIFSGFKLAPLWVCVVVVQLSIPCYLTCVTPETLYFS